MSIEAVAQFREAVNANEDWQEEIRNFGDDDNIVDYAQSKGHEFTGEQFNQYLCLNTFSDGQLSEFEMELVARWQLEAVLLNPPSDRARPPWVL